MQVRLKYQLIIKSFNKASFMNWQFVILYHEYENMKILTHSIDYKNNNQLVQGLDRCFAKYDEILWFMRKIWFWLQAEIMVQIKKNFIFELVKKG